MGATTPLEKIVAFLGK